MRRAAAGAQLRESKGKIAAAVPASGTTVTDLSGVGPVVAAVVIGDGEPHRQHRPGNCGI
jgi:hypothetical protein